MPFRLQEPLFPYSAPEVTLDLVGSPGPWNSGPGEGFPDSLCGNPGGLLFWGSRPVNIQGLLLALHSGTSGGVQGTIKPYQALCLC